MWPRIFRTFALLSAIQFVPHLVEADIRSTREQARGLQHAGKHVEAFRLLEASLAGAPDAAGLRRDLEKARKLAADSLARALQTSPGPDLAQELVLLASLRDIAPSDLRLPILVTNGDLNLSKFKSQLERAIALADSGEPALANEIAPTLESIAKVLPASRNDLRRLRLSLKLCDAKRSLAAGETLAALQAVKGAESLGAAQETTEEIYRNLEREVLERSVNDLKDVHSPRAYAEAAIRLATLARNCSLCGEASKALGDVESRFSRLLETAASSYASMGPVVSQSVECRILAALGDRARLLADPERIACEGTSRPSAATVETLVIRVPESCRVSEEVRRELISAAGTESDRQGPRGLDPAGQPAATDRGQLAIVVEDCSVSRAVRNHQHLGSTYRAASTKVPNPEYSAAVSEFAAAKQAADEVNRLAALYPDGRYLGSQIGAVARLVTARKRVDRTPPMIDQTIEATYTFEAFDQEVTARIAGELRVEYGSGEWRRLVPISAEVTKSGRVVQGVHPADTRGARNQEAQLPEDAALLGGLWDANLEGFRMAVVEAVSAKAALDAAEALESADVVPAASMLLLFSTVNAPVVEPKLLRLRERVLRNALLPATELFAEVRSDLLAYSRSLPKSARSPMHEAGQRDARYVADQVLDSVVFIMTETARGSGFFVRSDGLVLTNFHVVEGASLILLKTRSGEAASAHLVQYSKELDVAILKVEGVNARAVSIATGGQISIGQPVFALGAPLGLEFSATSGIVSATRVLNGYRLIQHDAPINPGSSGGPLIGPDGRVIGVNTWKIAEKGIEGLQFAIAIDAVQRALRF